MQILPINDLVVFDVQYVKGRAQTTWFSLSVDDAAIYSLSMPGIIEISSGKNTIGTFDTTDKRPLVVWIDPISGKYLSTKGIGLLGMQVLFPLIAGLTTAVVIGFDFAKPYAFGLILFAFSMTFFAGIKVRARDKQI